MAMSTGLKRSLMTVVFIFWSVALVVFGVFGVNKPESLNLPFLSQEAKPEPNKFYPLDKLVISLPGERYPRYLLLEMALQSPSEDMESKLIASDAVLKNSMIKLMGNKSIDTLNNTNQLEQLQDEAREVLQAVLIKHGFEVQLDAVFITRLVVQ